MFRYAWGSILLVSLAVLANVACPGWAIAEVVTLQPTAGANDGSDDGSATKGKDTGILQGGANDGSGLFFWLYNSPCNVGAHPGYLQFSLSGMPTLNVTKAEIQCYVMIYFNGSGWPWQVNPTLSLRRVTAAWDEMAVTEGALPAVDPAIVATQTFAAGCSPGLCYDFNGWVNFDVTNLYQDWIAGTADNYGVQYAIDNSYCANGDEFVLCTSDHTTAEQHPRLVVWAGEGQ